MRPVNGFQPMLPELPLLTELLGKDIARRLAAAPGGWRTLGEHELEALGLSGSAGRASRSLQELVRHGYPLVPRDPGRNPRSRQCGACTRSSSVCRASNWVITLSHPSLTMACSCSDPTPLGRRHRSAPAGHGSIRRKMHQLVLYVTQPENSTAPCPPAPG